MRKISMNWDCNPLLSLAVSFKIFSQILFIHSFFKCYWKYSKFVLKVLLTQKFFLCQLQNQINIDLFRWGDNSHHGSQYIPLVVCAFNLITNTFAFFKVCNLKAEVLFWVLGSIKNKLEFFLWYLNRHFIFTIKFN